MKAFRVGAGASDINEWTQTFTDNAGRAYKTVYPDGATAVMLYNSIGQFVQQTDPDGVISLTAYNARGEPDTRALRVDRSNTSVTPDYGGTDRITHTYSDVVTTNGVDVRRTLTFVWATNSWKCSLPTNWRLESRPNPEAEKPALRGPVILSATAGDFPVPNPLIDCLIHFESHPPHPATERLHSKPRRHRSAMGPGARDRSAGRSPSSEGRRTRPCR